MRRALARAVHGPDRRRRAAAGRRRRDAGVAGAAVLGSTRTCSRSDLRRQPRRRRARAADAGRAQGARAAPRPARRRLGVRRARARPARARRATRSGASWSARSGSRRRGVEGTARGDLREGPGHYPDTPLPGARGTVARGRAPHDLRRAVPRIDQLGRGDRIEMMMPYGRFTYTRRAHADRAADGHVGDEPRRHDRLVLTACHPLYSAAQRIVVFARLSTAGRAARRRDRFGSRPDRRRGARCRS